MSFTLLETLRAAVTAAGFGGFPETSPPSTSDLSTRNGTTQEIVRAEIDSTTNESDLFSIGYNLRALERAAQTRDTIIGNAHTIQEVLPEVIALIEDTPYGEFARDIEDDTVTGPIHRLQEALGVTHDGVLGAEASEALVHYFIDDLINETPTFTADLNANENQRLKSYLNTHVQDEVSHFNQAVTLLAQSAASQQLVEERDTLYNDLIVQEFEQCTGDTIDLESANPFGDIIQRITDAYAQTAGEVFIAQGHVSELIAEECGEYLQHISPDLREELVAGLAARLEEPIQTAVEESIDNARALHERLIMIQASVLGLNHSAEGLPVDPSQTPNTPF